MKYAFNDNGTLRDVVMTEPRLVFVPGYAERFIEVPDDAQTGYVWNGTHFAPPTGPTFEELKEQKLQSIQQEKIRVRDGGFDIDGTHYDSDLPARMSYNELAVRLQQNPEYTTPWKASEGQWVTMDAALYASVVTYGEAHMTAVFTWQATKEAEINACTTIEQLEAVGVTYGE